MHKSACSCLTCSPGLYSPIRHPGDTPSQLRIAGFQFQKHDAMLLALKTIRSFAGETPVQLDGQIGLRGDQLQALEEWRGWWTGSAVVARRGRGRKRCGRPKKAPLQLADQPPRTELLSSNLRAIDPSIFIKPLSIFSRLFFCNSLPPGKIDVQWAAYDQSQSPWRLGEAVEVASDEIRTIIFLNPESFLHQFNIRAQMCTLAHEMGKKRTSPPSISFRFYRALVACGISDFMGCLLTIRDSRARPFPALRLSRHMRLGLRRLK
jgi:hypothetical protein